MEIPSLTSAFNVSSRISIKRSFSSSLAFFATKEKMCEFYPKLEHYLLPYDLAEIQKRNKYGLIDINGEKALGESLDIRQGEFIGVIGHTGSGKSTLLRLIKPEMLHNGKRDGKILLGLCGIKFVSDAVIEAIKEGDQILEDLKSGKRKGYDNVYEMFKELDEDIANGRI